MKKMRMKKSPPKHPRLVEVDWVDSSIWKDGWDNVSEVVDRYRREGQDTIRSIGYVVDCTKEYMTIAGDLQFQPDWSIPRGCRFMTIPTGCIRTIKHLEGIGAKRGTTHRR